MKKILIIEDEVSLGDVLKQKLASAGFFVEVARDGLRGFNAIKELNPDLLITDVVLPSLNGFEIIMKKKADPSIADIPVIMLTNSVKEIQESDLKDLKISDFLIKSQLTPADILAKVQVLLKKGDEQNELNKNMNHLADKKILIVEDDVYLLKILSKRIDTEKATVRLVANGEAAIEELKKDTFDMVLLDILLPGINGFEVLKFLRDQEKSKDTPVIVISNFSQAEDQKKATDMGAQYLVKAVVTPDDIVATVNETFAKLGK